MADKILNSFDVWIAAQGWKSKLRLKSVDNISLEGVIALRELILELAVKGKLIPQNGKDEPARILLSRIAREREKMISEGKPTRQKPLQKIGEDEIPVQIPIGWEAERFGNIFNVINGRAYKMHEMLQEGTPLLRVGNLFTSNEWYYSDLELEPEKYIDDGDLIYAWSASFGPFIWNGGKAIYHYHIWKLDPYHGLSIDKRFFFHLLKAITKKIKNSGNGIAMIHMTKERMEKLVVTIPPLAEQNRIVAKVDELMTLCDELEQQKTNHLKSHQLLVETLLGTLTQAKFVRLKQITQINPRNDAEDQLEASFVPMSMVSTSHTGEHEAETRIWADIKKGFTHFADGDIGIAKITPCFENSKAIILSGLKNGIGAGTTELLIARPFGESINRRYILLNLKSSEYLKIGESKMTGTAGQKRLSKSFFESYPLPLPPLNEQHRIVAKVDELFTLCDRLKETITESQKVANLMADSILEQVV
jgi:restriction endonuclease S subunit